MFERNLTYQQTITMVTETCCKCGVAFAMPSDLRNRFLNKPEESFYCPNGHGQHFGESAEQKKTKQALEQLERAKKENSQLLVAKIQLEGEIIKIQRKLKRVSNGTCPCCNRSFQNLKRHMKSKHPEVIGSKPEIKK